MARPPLLHGDGAVPVDVEPLEERLDLRAVGIVAGGGERVHQLLQTELARLVGIDRGKRGNSRGLGLRLPCRCARLLPLEGRHLTIEPGDELLPRDGAVPVGVHRLEHC